MLGTVLGTVAGMVYPGIQGGRHIHRVVYLPWYLEGHIPRVVYLSLGS